MIASKCVKEYMALYRQWSMMLMKNMAGTAEERQLLDDTSRIWKKLTPNEIEYIAEAKRAM